MRVSLTMCHWWLSKIAILEEGACFDSVLKNMNYAKWVQTFLHIVKVGKKKRDKIKRYSKHDRAQLKKYREYLDVTFYNLN